MGALDTAKEIVRIGSTAGLGKDVIDLLEKKAALLTEEIGLRDLRIAELEIALSECGAKLLLSESSRAELLVEVGELRRQLQNPPPEVDLSGQQRDILFHLAHEDPGLTVEEIARSIGDIPSMAQHHCEDLADLELVEQVRFRGEHRRIEGPDWGFALTRNGRRWVAMHRD